jgi:hypothetical protein
MIFFVFFRKFFDKDIKFYQNLNNRQRKLLIYFFIFLFIFLFFYINNIKIERLISFFILLLLLLLWKIWIELCCYFLLDNNKLKNYIKYYDNIFTYIIKILLFIQKWKNPILLLLLFLDKLLFKCVRNLIYTYKIIYKKDLTSVWLNRIFYIYYFIINLALGPLKIIFGFFYIALRSLIEIPFSFFFIIRIIGFLFSLLILSDLYTYLYNSLGYLQLFFFLYLLLIIINMIVRYIGRDFLFLKIQYINNFIKTDYLINLRNHSTFFGFLLLTMNSYKTSLIERKYIDVTSSHLKIELEEGFYKYWEYYKRNTWFSTLNIEKEIKNRPSFYLYLNLLAWINISPISKIYALNAITNIIYIKYKINYLKVDLPIDLLNNLDYLYIFFFLRLKLLLFMIWDIDNYIDNNNWNYINYDYDKKFKNYNIKADYVIYDFFDFDNFKIEKNEKDLFFYDLEGNMEFFDRLYILIGFVPYNENPLEVPVYSEPILEIKNLAENIYSKLIRFDDSISWSRGWHYHIKEAEEQLDLLIEEQVKNWIIKFLNETRNEWINFDKNENAISDRNWRLLKELENLFIK